MTYRRRNGRQNTTLGLLEQEVLHRTRDLTCTDTASAQSLLISINPRILSCLSLNCLCLYSRGPVTTYGGYFRCSHQRQVQSSTLSLSFLIRRLSLGYFFSSPITCPRSFLFSSPPSRTKNKRPSTLQSFFFLSQFNWPLPRHV